MSATAKLKFWQLIVPCLLVLIYSYLSYFALFDQPSFFEVMQMPQINHDFTIISWAGKNTAVVVGLLLAILTRKKIPLLIFMAVLFTMQMGDVYAGAKTGVNVFVTYIALSLVLVETIILFISNTNPKK